MHRLRTCLRLIIAVTILASSVGYGAFGATVAPAAAAPTEGMVYGFGGNMSGQLGDGTTTDKSLPTPTASLPPGVTAIAAGGDFSLALAGGVVYAWGADASGQLGDGTVGTPDENLSPVAVTGLPADVTAIAAGKSHSLALVGGVVYAWGADNTGQLGDGTVGSPANSATPAIVTGLPADVTAIAAGGGHSLALAGGVVYAWGADANGQLGDGTVGSPTNSATPAAVTGLPTGVTAIGAGGGHSLAVAGGTAYAWGADASGQLGDGTVGSPTNSATPAAVTGLPAGVTAVDGGQFHSLALAGGVLYAWGNNSAGQLGDGAWVPPTVANRPTAAPVRNPETSGPMGNVAAFSAGPYHNLAVRADGIAFAWGSNSFGNFGSNYFLNFDTAIPQQVLLHNVTAVAAGGESQAHSLALTSDPIATLAPTSVDFTTQTINTTSAAQTVILTNTGAGPLQIGGIAVNGSDFGQTNTCPALLPAGGDCAIDVTFTPLALGSRTGTLVITDSAEGSPHAVGLSGTGVAPTIVSPSVSLSPTSLDFAAQTISTTSGPRTVTLTNEGPGALAITVIVTNGGDFAQVNTCPQTLAASASCTIDVTFTPLALGARSGTLTIVDSGTGSPHVVALAGTGAPATAEYTVNAAATGPGAVDPAGASTHLAGSEVAYTATPTDDAIFVGWTLDGVYVGYASTLTFTVNSNRTLVGKFVARPTFADVPTSDPDYQAIVFLAALGIVNPNGVNGSGQFQPDVEVKRAEVAAFIARTFGWEKEFHRNAFPDRCDPTGVNCIDDELWNTIAALADYGVVGGYTDSATCASAGTTAPCYLPRDPVKRVQVLSIIARAFTKTPDLRPTGFWDRLPGDSGQYTNVADTGTQRSDLTTYRANAGAVPGETSATTFPNPEGASLRRFVIAALYQAYAAQFRDDRVP